MKKVLLPILLLHLAVVVNAATYYFSSVSGDDSRTSAQAQSSSTPWKSITKLNSIMSILLPGDQVLFKRGETFEGAIIMNASGISTQPLVFGAYGSGNKPTISGFSNLSGWTQVRSNVWQAPLSVASNYERMVTMNNKQQGIGRYPNFNAANSGYLNIDSHSGATELTSSQLPVSPNWTGGDVVIRKNRWVIDRSAITYQYGNTIGIVSGSNYGITDKYGFFVVNHTNTLDQDGEWYYDKTNKMMQMYFTGNNPSSYQVKASTVETLVTISFRNYITFNNLAFTGANSYAFNLTNSNNITINNCTLNFSGINAIEGLSAGYLTVSNSIINYTNNNGMNLHWNCFNTLITNSKIKNTSLFAGMNQNSDFAQQGIYIRGNNNMIQYNEVDSSGNDGIHFEGDYSTVQYNFVNVFGLISDDCGGIYTGQGLGDLTVCNNKSILNNIVLNGIGAGNGTNDTSRASYATQGIYIDDNSNHVFVTGNTAAYCNRAGIFSHNNNDIVITNNTMFCNGVEQFLGVKKNGTSNITLTGNIMFSKTADQLVSRLASNTGKADIGEFGNFNNNYYCRPMDNNYMFFNEYYVGSTYNSSYDNLTTWTARFNYDKNSKGSPAIIPAFTYSNLSGVNKYSNGSYNTNVGDVGSFASTGDISKVWVASKLDAGTMQVTSNNYTSNNNYMLSLPLNSSVEAGKSYLLTFSLQGGASGRPMEVYLRNTSGNKDLSSRTKIPIDVNRNNIQLGFLATTSSAGSVELDVAQPNGAVWVDNVNLQEATITPTNADNYIIFKYNASANVKTVNIGSTTYYDAKGATYSGKITLQPYSSIVLFKQSGTTSTFKTSSDAQAIKLQGSLTDASAASFTASPSANVSWQVDNQGATASYYSIERSPDGNVFTSLGKTNVKRENTASISYEYSDAAPSAGKNWYRITQYDEKSVALASKVVMVNNISFRVNPNPVQNTMHLFFNGLITADDHIGKDVVIRNLSGTVVKTLQLPSTENIKMVDLDASSLKSGMYILSIAAEGKLISKQFLKL